MLLFLADMAVRQVSFTGRILQVKVQVTVVQINKQAQKCLVALITI